MTDRKKKKETDFSITAFRVVQEATEENSPEKPETKQEETAEGKNPNAVALGRLGGLKGGKARASKLSPEQRKEIARKAAKTRWGKEQQK